VRPLALLLLCAGCELAWAQPRRRPRDAGVRDAGAVVLRPATHGRLDPSAVRAVVAGASDAVQRCYDRAVARDPTARGELEVRVRVEEDGAVSETAGRTEEASLRETTRCIEGVFRALRFSRPTGGAATVVVPYRFAPGS
jgi:hypothetical protein